MSKPESTVSIPKSMRHKRILDVAAENPDASIEELAENVPSATSDLVENILEKYGDPANNNTNTDEDSEPGPPASSTGPGDDLPDPGELTSSQHEILELLQEYPEATQRELSDHLGVSPATISNRVNAIPGFSWDDRIAITNTILDTHHDNNASAMTSQNGTQKPTTSDLHDRIETIETRLNTERAESPSAFDDPEFAYKVLRACMDADNITEEEERRLFTELHK